MYFLGIDGCKKGWVISKLTSNYSLNIEVYKNLEDIRKLIEGASSTLIDMPMGLPFGLEYNRTTDSEARTYLSKRKMSIFSIPCRESIYTNNYKDSLILSRELTGKGFSKQAFYLFPKIRELDRFIQKDINLTNKIFEGHPEISFLRVEHEPNFSKKTIEGIEERIKIIEKYIPNIQSTLDDVNNRYLKKDVLIDDILDSVILALSLKISTQRGYTFIPTNYLRDSFGIPMRIFLLNQ